MARRPVTLWRHSFLTLRTFVRVYRVPLCRPAKQYLKLRCAKSNNWEKYLTISFLLLTLGFFISSFFSCFRCRVRLFIWLFSCFLRYTCIAKNFLLRIAFTVSHRFWVVVFSFSFVSMQILIFFLISSVICWLFSSVLFSLHILDFLTVFLL